MKTSISPISVPARGECYCSLLNTRPRNEGSLHPAVRPPLNHY
jgi:hypothetical protein